MHVSATIVVRRLECSKNNMDPMQRLSSRYHVTALLVESTSAHSAHLPSALAPNALNATPTYPSGDSEGEAEDEDAVWGTR